MENSSRGRGSDGKFRLASVEDDFTGADAAAIIGPAPSTPPAKKRKLNFNVTEKKTLAEACPPKKAVVIIKRTK